MKSKTIYVLQKISFVLFAAAVFSSSVAVVAFYYQTTILGIDGAIAVISPFLFIPAIIVYGTTLLLKVMEKKFPNSLMKYDKWFVVVLVIIGIGILGYFMYQAYLVDQASIKAANDRANFYPDYNLPDADPFQDYNLPDPEPQESIESLFGLSTTTYPLNYENLASGKIFLEGVIVPGLESSNHLPNVLFENAQAKKCYSKQGNKYINCENFSEGMLTLIDVLPLSQSLVAKQNENNSDFALQGFVLLEVNLNGEKKIIIYSLAKYSYQYTNLHSYHASFNHDLKIPDGDYKLGFVEHFGSLLNREVTLIDVVGKGKVFRLMYELLGSRHGPYGNFTVLNDDLRSVTRKISKSIELTYGIYDFWTTSSYRIGNLFYNGDLTLKEQKIPKGYFQEACDLPNSFADKSLVISSNIEALYMNYKISLDQDQDTYYLTTPYYGYDPMKWGTVVDQVSVKDYKKSVINGTPFNNYPTELLFLLDFAVRHTLPVNPPRPCDNRTYEQYQWVKENNLYTLEVSYAKQRVLTEDERDFITNTIKVLIKGTRYTPKDEFTE